MGRSALLGSSRPITVMDQDDRRLYQPGLLLLPSGVYRPDDLIKPRKRFIPSGVDLVRSTIVAEGNCAQDWAMNDAGPPLQERKARSHGWS